MDLTCIATQIDDALSVGSLDTAADLFLTQIDALLASAHPQASLTLFHKFPQSQRISNPALLYIEGIIHARMYDFDPALAKITKAYSLFAQSKNAEGEVSCLLEMAHIHQSMEEFQTAFFYLNEEARPLLEKSDSISLETRARFLQRMATISPDIGHHAASIDYANDALALYREIGHTSGQHDMLILLSDLLRKRGEYSIANGRLRQARHYCTVNQIEHQAVCNLLNSEAHMQWHLGDFPTATEIANKLLTLSEVEGLATYRVLSHSLMGDLQREQDQHSSAKKFYTKAKHIAEEAGHQHLIPSIDANIGWLAVREGNLNEGRRLLHSSLATSDRGQAMRFRVSLAAIDSLAGDFEVAEERLRRSLSYYQRSGEALAQYAILLHLAYVYLHTKREELAKVNIANTLSWLDKREVAYIPLWWQPTILGDVCAYALSANIQVDVAERILIRHLGENGARAVRGILSKEEMESEARLRRVLQLADGTAYPELQDIQGTGVHRILVQLLEQGRLCATGLADLCDMLVTGSVRQQKNPTMVAVFALYVNGYDRIDIAEQLNCAERTVRNYITDIYQIFDLPQSEWKGQRRARRRKLIQLSQIRGYICPPSKAPLTSGDFYPTHHGTFRT